jgi:hypothetical protein
MDTGIIIIVVAMVFIAAIIIYHCYIKISIKIRAK